MTSGKQYACVLVDVDTQNDFVEPSGALHVAGAEKLVGNFRALISWAARTAVPVLSTADAHAVDDPEFERFPPHCVVGTRGQEKVAGTLLDGYKVIVADGSGPAGPEVFAAHPQLVLETPTLSMFDNAAAGPIVTALEAERFVVFGVATDYCVRLAVEGLLSRGKRVSLVVDAIEGIDKSASAEIVGGFEGQGVRLTTTVEVTGG